MVGVNRYAIVVTSALFTPAKTLSQQGTDEVPRLTLPDKRRALRRSRLSAPGSECALKAWPCAGRKLVVVGMNAKAVDNLAIPTTEPLI